jgi:hypothetical protein
VKRVDLTVVGAATVTVVDKFSARSETLPAAAVVDCGARLPEDGLWRSTGSTLVRAGDAVAPRTVLEAVLEGRRAAQAVVSGSGARRPQPVGALGGGG